MIKRLLLPLLLLTSTSLVADVRDDQLFEQVRPIRVMKIELYDQGTYGEGSHDVAIDTQQNICPSDLPEPQPEPFFETLAGIYVYNKSVVPIRFDSVRFFIKKLNRRSYKSKKMSLANIGFVESGETARLLALLLTVNNGQKYLYPNRGPLPVTPGAANVKFELKGIAANGKRVKTVGKIALAFRDVDRCQ